MELNSRAADIVSIFDKGLEEHNAEKINFNKQYWDSYYSSGDHSVRNMPPSQFAAFCLIEMQEMAIVNLVEIASGNGRDALFFGDHGIKVLATDSSEEAVKLLEERSNGHPKVNVLNYDATKKSVGFKRDCESKTAFYARFFLHTLDDNGLHKFFKNVSSIMRPGDMLFLEYRNIEDSSAPKVTKAHFRAFHGAEKISKISKANHLKSIYEVSGRGFAKWRQDDAFITRQIFEYHV
jgi:hypothetical protein